MRTLNHRLGLAVRSMLALGFLGCGRSEPGPADRRGPPTGFAPNCVLLRQIELVKQP